MKRVRSLAPVWSKAISGLERRALGGNFGNNKKATDINVNLRGMLAGQNSLTTIGCYLSLK